MTQHVLILGGSSGIGLETTRHLLAAGKTVTITGRNQDRLNQAVNGLEGDVRIRVMDAADYPSLPTAFEQIGAIDHLVLALGSSKGAGPFASVALNEVRAGFEEKVFPHFAAAQAALPTLRKDGSITFISAITAQAAMPGTAGIGAANAAIAALVPILANELRPLRVNAVSPGVIDTPWWDFLAEDDKTAAFADFAAKSPVGRVGKAEDVAAAISFLISDTYVTGQILGCDGGLRFAA